jgi:hypothetical protein
LSACVLIFEEWWTISKAPRFLLKGCVYDSSISLWLSRIMSSYFSCNSYCNLLLAWIMKQFNSPDVWFLVATSLATEKISVATQLATQLHKSRCESNGLKFYWAISYFSVYWEIAKPLLKRGGPSLCIDRYIRLFILKLISNFLFKVL